MEPVKVDNLEAVLLILVLFKGFPICAKCLVWQEL